MKNVFLHGFLQETVKCTRHQDFMTVSLPTMSITFSDLYMVSINPRGPDIISFPDMPLILGFRTIAQTLLYLDITHMIPQHIFFHMWMALSSQHPPRRSYNISYLRLFMNFPRQILVICIIFRRICRSYCSRSIPFLAEICN